MNRATLADFRAQFPTENMGLCSADPKVTAYCNEAQQRLLIDSLAPDEGWADGWVTVNLTATVVNQTAYVTVPQNIVRLIVLDVCKHPIHIRNGFWEFLPFGLGLQPKTCRVNCGSPFSAYERDNVVTLSPLLATPQKIRVYPTDIRDTGLRVLLQGKDQNRLTILTTDPGTGTSAPGEYLQLAFPFMDSVNQFTEITGMMKDQTYGPLQFFQVDPNTGAEVALSAMEPNESTASYRRYLISGIPSQNLCCATPTSPLQITAQGRLAFTPVQNETDYLTINCVPALLEESMSIRFGRMESAAAAQQSGLHHAKAIALLNGQMDQVYGKTNTAVRMPLFGSNRMRRQPV